MTHSRQPTPSESPKEKQTVAVILGADWEGTTGTLGFIPVEEPRIAETNLEVTHSDAVIRSFDGLLYVINRRGADNIQVVDPADFSTIQQFSVGLGTNPHDLVAVNRSKAYVTLYEPESNQSPFAVDDLLIVDPTTGSILGAIDLTPFTRDDGDRRARASSMLLIDDQIYVALQDLPSNLSAQPDQPGKLLRIDPQEDRVMAATVLECRNPFSMSYSEGTGKIYIACSDFFGLESPYGGIETVDPERMSSEGILYNDESLGGWVGHLETGTEAGFAVVGLPDYSANEVVRFDLSGAGEPVMLYSSAHYIPEIAFHESVGLLVIDRDPGKNGVLFIEPQSGKLLDGPINVGAPPASITFVER